jgi:hypothetical protein
VIAKIQIKFHPTKTVCDLRKTILDSIFTKSRISGIKQRFISKKQRNIFKKQRFILEKQRFISAF